MVWAPSPRTSRPRTTEVILTIASITGGPYTEPVGELGEDDIVLPTFATRRGTDVDGKQAD